MSSEAKGAPPILQCSILLRSSWSAQNFSFPAKTELALSLQIRPMSLLNPEEEEEEEEEDAAHGTTQDGAGGR